MHLEELCSSNPRNHAMRQENGSLKHSLVRRHAFKVFLVFAHCGVDLLIGCLGLACKGCLALFGRHFEKISFENLLVSLEELIFLLEPFFASHLTSHMP